MKKFLLVAVLGIAGMVSAKGTMPTNDGCSTSVKTTTVVRGNNVITTTTTTTTCN